MLKKAYKSIDIFSLLNAFFIIHQMKYIVLMEIESKN